MVCVAFVRAVSPATRSNNALHRASAKTGRVGAIPRRADHQEQNLRAAKPIRALPQLFASFLHERDLRSFNAPRRCTCSLRAPSPCRPVRPIGGVSTKMVYCRLFGSLLTDFPKKHALRSRLRPGLPRLVFIPNSQFGAGAGYAQYRVMFEGEFRLSCAPFRTRSMPNRTPFCRKNALICTWF